MNTSKMNPVKPFTQKYFGIYINTNSEINKNVH